jgi:hypothetical protein
VNSFLEQLTGPWGARVAAAGALAGGVGGGAFYLSLSGVLWGLLSVLGALGVLATASDAVARLTGAGDAPATAVSAPVAEVAAGAASAVEEETGTEAELLSQGRFDEYHLAKAKRFMAAGDGKQAAYHAGASLAHGDLPEAHRLRKSALGRA